MPTTRIADRRTASMVMAELRSLNTVNAVEPSRTRVEMRLISARFSLISSADLGQRLAQRFEHLRGVLQLSNRDPHAPFAAVIA